MGQKEEKGGKSKSEKEKLNEDKSGYLFKYCNTLIICKDEDQEYLIISTY